MTIKTTIKKNGYGEWVVRLWEGGKQVGSYFTNDKQDAEDTARDMVKRYVENIANKGEVE